MNDYRSGELYVVKPKPRQSHRDLLEGYCLAATSSYLIRRHALLHLLEIDGYIFDPKYITGQEYNVAIRLTRWSDVICLQEALSIQNAALDNLSQNWKKKIRGKFIMVMDMRDELGWRRSLKHLGVIPLFYMGYFLGNKQRVVIDWLKEIRHGRF